MHAGYGTRISLHAAASVAMATPAYTWQTGAFGTITDNGAGDLTHNLGADYSLNSSQGVFAGSRNSAAQATNLTSFGVTPVSAVAWRVTALVEAPDGEASVLTDVDMFAVFWKFQV